MGSVDRVGHRGRVHKRREAILEFSAPSLDHLLTGDGQPKPVAVSGTRLRDRLQPAAISEDPDQPTDRRLTDTEPLSQRSLGIRTLRADHIEREKPPIGHAGLGAQEPIRGAIQASGQSVEASAQISIHQPNLASQVSNATLRTQARNPQTVRSSPPRFPPAQLTADYRFASAGLQTSRPGSQPLKRHCRRLIWSPGPLAEATGCQAKHELAQRLGRILTEFGLSCSHSTRPSVAATSPGRRLSAGYADQKHLVRDFRAFAELPPSRWLREEFANVQDDGPSDDLPSDA